VNDADDGRAQPIRLREKTAAARSRERAIAVRTVSAMVTAASKFGSCALRSAPTAARTALPPIRFGHIDRRIERPLVELRHWSPPCVGWWAVLGAG
jgi:hypothetical protein